MSLAISLVFHAFLLANEILGLQVTDLCFARDNRLSDFLTSRAGCVIRTAKAGKNQFAPLTDAVLLRCLHCFVQSR